MFALTRKIIVLQNYTWHKLEQRREPKQEKMKNLFMNFSIDIKLYRYTLHTTLFNMNSRYIRVNIMERNIPIRLSVILATLFHIFGLLR